MYTNIFLESPFIKDKNCSQFKNLRYLSTESVGISCFCLRNNHPIGGRVNFVIVGN